MTWWAPAASRERRLGRAGDSCDDGGTCPARELDGGVTHRTRPSGDQHNLAGEGTGMQPLSSVFRHCQGTVSGHCRYAEAGANVETGAFGKSYDPARGQVRVFLRGACRPLVAGEIYPDTIPHCEVDNPLPDCVDDTRTVLVRSYLRERRRCSVARTNTDLPVGGVDAGDDDADADLARPRFGHIAIHEPQNRNVTGLGVDDRPHACDNFLIFGSFQVGST